MRKKTPNRPLPAPAPTQALGGPAAGPGRRAPQALSGREALRVAVVPAPPLLGGLGRRGAGEPTTECRPPPAIASPALATARRSARFRAPRPALQCCPAAAVPPRPARSAPEAWGPSQVIQAGPGGRFRLRPRVWGNQPAGPSSSAPSQAAPRAAPSPSATWPVRQWPEVPPRAGLSPSAMPRTEQWPEVPSRAGLSPSAMPRTEQWPEVPSRAGLSPSAMPRAEQWPEVPSRAGLSPLPSSQKAPSRAERWERCSSRATPYRGEVSWPPPNQRPPTPGAARPASTRTELAPPAGPAAGNRCRQTRKVATPASCARWEAPAARSRSGSEVAHRAAPLAARSGAPTGRAATMDWARERPPLRPEQKRSAPMTARASASARRAWAQSRLRPPPVPQPGGWSAPMRALSSSVEPASAPPPGFPGRPRFQLVGKAPTRPLAWFLLRPRPPLSRQSPERPALPPAMGARVLSAGRRQASPEAALAPSGPAVAVLFPLGPLGGQSIAAATTPQRLSTLREYVLEGVLCNRVGLLLGPIGSLRSLSVALCLRTREVIGCQPATLDEPRAEASYRVVCGRLVDLFLAAVFHVVVLRRVGVHAPDLGVYQGRSISSSSSLHRLFAECVAGGDVGAIDRGPGNAIARGAIGHVGVRHLQPDGHADGVAVVLADEDDGQAVDRREVDPLVEIALARRPIAKRAQGHGTPASEPGGVRDSRRLRHPGRDDLRHRGDLEAVVAVAAAGDVAAGRQRIVSLGEHRQHPLLHRQPANY